MAKIWSSCFFVYCNLDSLFHHLFGKVQGPNGDMGMSHAITVGPRLNSGPGTGLDSIYDVTLSRSFEEVAFLDLLGGFPQWGYPKIVGLYWKSHENGWFEWFGDTSICCLLLWVAKVSSHAACCACCEVYKCDVMNSGQRSNSNFCIKIGACGKSFFKSFYHYGKNNNKPAIWEWWNHHL